MISYNPALAVKNPSVRARKCCRSSRGPKYWPSHMRLGSTGRWCGSARPRDCDPRNGSRWNARISTERTAESRSAGHMSLDGRVEFKGKTAESIRSVPLLQVALDALDELPPRIDTRFLFPNSSGGIINLNNFRMRDWYPALESAGLAKRGPYALRHTYATFLLDQGMSIFKVARWMGTSAEMIERHYGHWLADSDESELDRLDNAFNIGSPDAAAIPS